MPIIIGSVISLMGHLDCWCFTQQSLQYLLIWPLLRPASRRQLPLHGTLSCHHLPKTFIGISVGVRALLLFIGMAIGPALTGVYLDSHKTIAEIPGSYPSASYNLVYLTSALLSAVSLGLVLMLKKRVGKKETEV